MHLLANDMPNNTKSKSKFRQLKFQSIDARSKDHQDAKQPEWTMPLFKIIDQIQTTPPETENVSICEPKSVSDN